ncbi:ABC transporter permease, partial [Clostridioides difficile]
MRLSLAYVKKYFGRSISIALSIIISISLIITVGILTKNTQKASVDRIKYESGDYHVKVKNISGNVISDYKKQFDISMMGVSSYYDSSEFNGKLMLNLIKSNEDYIKIYNSKILNGRFPTSDNEVALEEWVMLNLGLKLDINQNIKIKLYNSKETKNYKVVGILKDRPYYKSIGMAELILPFTENIIKETNLEAQIRFKKDIYRNLSKLMNDNHISRKNVSENRILLDALGESNGLNYDFIFTCIISMIVSGVVIYSIFRISIIQRISEYGIIRALGANIFNVFNIIFVELFAISLVSIPIGVLIGIISSKYITLFMGNLLIGNIVKINNVEINLDVVMISIITVLVNILIISFLTCTNVNKISPIKCIKKDISKKNSRESSILNTRRLLNLLPIEYIISLKNILKNKKNFVIIVLSMSGGCIIFILTNFTNILDERQLEYTSKVATENSDYNISFAPVTPLNIGISEENLKQIRQLEGIENVKTSQVMYSRMILNKDNINNMNYFEKVNKSAYNKKALNGLLVKKDNEYILKSNLYGYDNSSIDAQKSFVISGDIDLDKMNNGNVAILYMPDPSLFTNIKDSRPVLNLKVGDIVKLRFRSDYVSDENFAKLKDKGEYVEEEFKIGAIVSNILNVDGYYAGMDSASIIISQNQFKNIVGIHSYRMLDIKKIPTTDNIELGKNIIDISSKIQGSIVRDFTQEIKNIKIIEDNKKILIYTIILVLFTISFINIINN